MRMYWLSATAAATAEHLYLYITYAPYFLAIITASAVVGRVPAAAPPTAAFAPPVVKSTYLTTQDMDVVRQSLAARMTYAELPAQHYAQQVLPSQHKPQPPALDTPGENPLLRGGGTTAGARRGAYR
jgi:hypothetical protein